MNISAWQTGEQTDAFDISLLVKTTNDKRKCWKKNKKKNNTKNESYTEVNNYKKWNKHRGRKEFLQLSIMLYQRRAFALCCAANAR